MKEYIEVSIAGKENGIFETEDSTREWSGEVFWNEDWNIVMFLVGRDEDIL